MTANVAFLHSVPFFGFYLPPILIWALAALVPYLALRAMMRRWNLDRFLWHRALFDLAIYVLLVGGVIFIGGRGWL